MSIGLRVWCASPNRIARRLQGGFTLLEVLVAFVILAVALVALFQAFSSGLRGLDVAEASMTAVQHARSKLEEVGGPIPIESGQQSGDFTDGYQWVVVIEPEADEDLVFDAAQPLIPYRVQVTVNGAQGGSVTLDTWRLGPRP